MRFMVGGWTEIWVGVVKQAICFPIYTPFGNENADALSFHSLRLIVRRLSIFARSEKTHYVLWKNFA